MCSYLILSKRCNQLTNWAQLKHLCCNLRVLLYSTKQHKHERIWNMSCFFFWLNIKWKKKKKTEKQNWRKWWTAVDFYFRTFRVRYALYHSAICIILSSASWWNYLLETIFGDEQYLVFKHSERSINFFFFCFYLLFDYLVMSSIWFLSDSLKISISSLLILFSKLVIQCTLLP